MKLIMLSLMLWISSAYAQDVVESTQLVEVGSPIKSAPSPFGPVVGELKAGDKVKVVGSEGPWSQVANEQGESLGWLHSSALRKKSFSLINTDNQAEVSASSDELALAGRGFNSEVESEFKQGNADLPFDQIDTMEGRAVSLADAVAFLQQGGLLEATPSEETAPNEDAKEGGDQ